MGIRILSHQGFRIGLELLETYVQMGNLLHLQSCRRARLFFGFASANRKHGAGDLMPAFLPSRITGVTRPDLN